MSIDDRGKKSGSALQGVAWALTAWADAISAGRQIEPSVMGLRQMARIVEDAVARECPSP